MSSHSYLLWAIAQQQIRSDQKPRVAEDEFYEKYGQSPGRFSSLLQRVVVLVRSWFSGIKSS